ncbi:MAG: RloB domain-containing protein [Bacteroidales bacterium]|nr:MAG: RloB domain-containing protein [Bacteroidales bacterium]
MARKGYNRSIKHRVAIVGEGLTEWYYFDNMRQHEHFYFKVEPALPKHSDYKTIISTARKKRDEGHDQVFCVLDLDRILANETEKKGYFSEKSKKIVNKGIEFIESMPCIELWFLLHFINEYSSRIYQNYDQISIPLRNYIPTYNKTEEFLRGNKIYEYLENNGNTENANNYAVRMLSERQLNGNPLFNFTRINELIHKLKNN